MDDHHLHRARRCFLRPGTADAGSGIGTTTATPVAGQTPFNTLTFGFAREVSADAVQVVALASGTADADIRAPGGHRNVQAQGHDAASCVNVAALPATGG